MNSSRRFNLTRTTCFLFLLGICVLLATSRVAFAQDAGSDVPPAAPAASGATSAANPGANSGANSSSTAKTAVKNGSKRTEINFEDQLIEGNGSKPGIFFFMQQKGNSFKKLIKLRENFLPEMRRTSDEVVRKGSGN